jgi:hypothetical protein
MKLSATIRDNENDCDISCIFVWRSRAREKASDTQRFDSHSTSSHIVRSRGVAVCTLHAMSVILTYNVYIVFISLRLYVQVHCQKYCETIIVNICINLQYMYTI